MCDLSNKITALFHLFANEFEYKHLGPTSNVVESFNEIFSEIDEYELVKAVLFTEELRGNDNITISKLAQEIEKFQMEIKKIDTNKFVN